MNFSRREALEREFKLCLLRGFLALFLCCVALFSTSIAECLGVVDTFYLTEYAWSIRVTAFMGLYYLLKKNFI